MDLHQQKKELRARLCCQNKWKETAKKKSRVLFTIHNSSGEQNIPRSKIASTTESQRSRKTAQKDDYI
jgi:hypothetical protein